MRRTMKSLLFGFGLFHVFRTLGMGFPALGLFLGFAQDHIVAIGAGNGAFNEEEIVGLVDLHDLEVLGGAADLAHVAGHFHAAHDRAGKEALADGAGAAVPALGAVGRIAPSKAVPAHHAFKTAPLGHADRVHIVAG